MARGKLLPLLHNRRIFVIPHVSLYRSFILCGLALFLLFFFFFFAAFFIVEPPLSLPDLTAQVWKEFRIVLCVFRQWRIWIHLCVIRQLRCQWFLCMFLSLHSSSFCNLKETIYMFFYSKAQEWIVLYMCPLSVYALG